MDSTSWRDKKYEEYLKMISLNDAIIKDENDKTKTSENGSFTNITKMTNNMILLPKYLENVRNSIYNNKNKSIIEAKSMIEHAMSDNVKVPLFKTGKIISEMLPSPDYEKYWTKSESPFVNSLDDTTLIQDMVFKIFNLNKTKTDNSASSSGYCVNYCDIFKIILKGINSIKNENEEIHIFLRQLLNKTKKNCANTWNKESGVSQLNLRDKYNYSFLPLNIYNNSIDISREILKYSICNYDLAKLFKLTKRCVMGKDSNNDNMNTRRLRVYQFDDFVKKYREYLYEWNQISDSQICTLSILKLYLNNSLDTQNSRIENNENFYSLSERLITSFLKIIKLKTPFINRQDFYINEYYEMEELDLNGTLWLLRRNVFQILLEADRIIKKKVF
ncbi:hypothetical protein PMLGA01_110024000 [Plasmodium malariae]|uniref:Uncharacterized protein n=1 Tax=Plasmodium malariae TaxID=5858 RepID=A0A1C3KZE9_PLAMA|nr:hypothetical protein PMLGA01_110024000 [Plasmodium malariae]